MEDTQKAVVSEGKTEISKETEEKEYSQKEEINAKTETKDAPDINDILIEGELNLPGTKKKAKVVVKRKYLQWIESKTKFLLLWDSVVAVKQTEKMFTLLGLVLTNEAHEGGINAKRVKKQYSFICESKEESEKWTKTISSLLLPNGSKRIHMFVNPFSGKKKANKIVAEIKPLFEISGHKLTVIETKNRFHALEYVREMDLKETDAIVTVSGDGLLWEVVNGLMQRKDSLAAIKTPIGIIPAGTGNALAASLGSFKDPLTAALYIIKFYTQPLDLWRVVQKDVTSWSFLEIAWGVIADVDIESEKFRWMGDARYTFGGVAGIMAFRQYKGRFSYLPVEAEGSDDSIIKHSDFSKPPSNWKVIEDEFFCLLAANIPYISTDLLAAPKAHAGDGTIDVLLARKGHKKMDRIDALKLFTQMEKGEHCNSKDVEYFKVKAFTLEPGPEVAKKPRNGIIIMDGEKMDYSPLSVEIFQKLAVVIGAPPKPRIAPSDLV